MSLLVMLMAKHHVQKRVWHPHTIALRPAHHLEPHVPVERQCPWILFVDIDEGDSLKTHGRFYKPPA